MSASAAQGGHSQSVAVTQSSSSSLLWSLQRGGGVTQLWLVTTASHVTSSGTNHVVDRPHDTWLITDLTWLLSNTETTTPATTTTTTTTTITSRPHIRLVVVVSPLTYFFCDFQISLRSTRMKLDLGKSSWLLDWYLIVRCPHDTTTSVS